jgi:hypothetical protein
MLTATIACWILWIRLIYWRLFFEKIFSWEK